jgi:hypothetical protein
MEWCGEVEPPPDEEPSVTELSDESGEFVGRFGYAFMYVRVAGSNWMELSAGKFLGRVDESLRVEVPERSSLRSTSLLGTKGAVVRVIFSVNSDDSGSLTPGVILIACGSRVPTTIPETGGSPCEFKAPAGAHPS